MSATPGKPGPIFASRVSHSDAETRMVGQALGRVLRGGDVVLLDGPLGAGKTTLVRAIAEGLGVETGGVASPTFVLIHEYRPRGNGPELIHVDAYRLSGGEELETLGWDQVVRRVEEGSAALVVEWAERLGAEIPGKAAARIRLDHMAEHERELSMELPGRWAGRDGLAEVLNRRPARCPVTGELVPPESPTYPFSSERARRADLYKWFSGSYQISRGITAEDVEEPPPAP